MGVVTKSRSKVDSPIMATLLSSFSDWASQGTVSQGLFKLTSIESVMPSNRLTLCRPFSSYPQCFPASGSFSSESALRVRWPKYWSLNFSISLSGKYWGLISLRIDWFDLLAIQGTLKSLLQHRSSKTIGSLALSLLYGPALTSVHDYWKNRSFDSTDLCWQSEVFAF